MVSRRVPDGFPQKGFYLWDGSFALCHTGERCLDAINSRHQTRHTVLKPPIRFISRLDKRHLNARQQRCLYAQTLPRRVKLLTVRTVAAVKVGERQLLNLGLDCWF